MPHSHKEPELHLSTKPRESRTPVWITVGAGCLLLLLCSCSITVGLVFALGITANPEENGNTPPTHQEDTIENDDPVQEDIFDEDEDTNEV
ncbi:MAG: hypothetical protein ACOCXT_04960 [Candidatus Dojkabacteria bacterium]